MSLESISRISELTGKGSRTIKSRLDTLTPVQDGKALKYETKEALPLLYGLDTQGAFDLEQERARLAHHQANNEALKEEVAKKNLIPAEEVLNNWINLVARFKAKMLAIPSKSAHRCAQSTDHHEIESVLKSAITEALNELGND